MATKQLHITQQDGKRKIIDTFINAIYVYDDHFKIVYNGNNKEETVSLEALENSSTLFSSGAPTTSVFERKRRLFFCFFECKKRNGRKEPFRFYFQMASHTMRIHFLVRRRTTQMTVLMIQSIFSAM